MRILAISDTEEDRLTTRAGLEALGPLDFIVSCGDLPATYLETIVTLANVPLLYVPGNHDTSYAEHPPLGCTPIDGKLISCCGLRIVGLGGSLRYNDRVYGFTEQEMRWRMYKIALRAKWSGGADLMVTHAPPRGFGDLDDYPHRGFESFNVALDMLRPRLLVHGHVHMEYGRIERERDHPSGARLVNACGSRIIEF
ncbi:metallophosphoesterase family protein [[Collinsella] massiliensis]|uniref:Calcineurin-like phosphoesterase domain-containing protein n=1 Tax=[Collinsella] massiliensis TaxID=1232426 RepID=A0A1Y3XU73_9ACTN|nr:metallophosphoesterase family protein [[Collinsella] massiliensis]OUN89103.1 hypothetical protein B5G02_03785 [[Collinsella] massiliensis]